MLFYAANILDFGVCFHQVIITAAEQRIWKTMIVNTNTNQPEKALSKRLPLLKI
jgi:hypothetical protein